MNNLVNRFLDYVKFDTQSDELTNLTPSTPGQMVFAQYLEKELNAMGMKDVTLDDNGYLMATLPGNVDGNVPTVGFIAHLDTSPDMSGRHVNPRIVSDYDGKDIVLNADNGVVLSPSEFPELLHYVGQKLIVTDGNTLLGADDKAGIAEIVTAMEYLMAHPEIKHGDIRVAFNPDEEIGLGAHKFDVEAFGADWAYTMDGGEVGELEYENFNAAVARVTFKGRNVHHRLNFFTHIIVLVFQFKCSTLRKFLIDFASKMFKLFFATFKTVTVVVANNIGKYSFLNLTFDAH